MIEMQEKGDKFQRIEHADTRVFTDLDFFFKESDSVKAEENNAPKKTKTNKT